MVNENPDLSQVSDWMLDDFIEEEVSELNRNHQAQVALLRRRVLALEGPHVQLHIGFWGTYGDPIPLSQLLTFRSALCAELKMPYPPEWAAEEKRWERQRNQQEPKLSRIERTADGNEAGDLFGWDPAIPEEGHS